MGNRQINHSAFTHTPNCPYVDCNTVLYYDTIQLKTLNLIRNDLLMSHSQSLHTQTDYILAAMAYMIRENHKEKQTLSYLFYKNGTLIVKIMYNWPNMDLDKQKIETEPHSYQHTQCNLDILFQSTK